MKHFIIIAAVVLMGALGYAGEGHNHEAAVENAPHGGVLRDAPPFKVELVLDGDAAKLHVYDKNMKSIKPDKEIAKGQLRFPKEKTSKEVIFKRKGEVYEATLTGVSKVHRYDLHVNLDITGKKVLADFGVDNIH